MRSRAGVLVLLTLLGCEHEVDTRLAPKAASRGEAASRDDRTSGPSYVVAEGTGTSSAARLELANDERGIILDGRRLVVSAASARAASDVTVPPLVAADKIPAFLGGGFLFRSRSSLYESDTFEGPLRPVASFPADLYEVSFGPTAALVRASDGQRWMIDLKTGDRVPISPPAVVEVAALADGRAVAITEGGGALVSRDRGAHWADVSAELTGRPATVFAQAAEGALWITQSSGPALRVLTGGKLARFDAAPKSAPAPHPPDPRWRASDPPLRHAILHGAPTAGSTAVAIVEGDVMRLSLSTGEILSVTPGRLPPEAECDPVRTADDLIFVCKKPTGEHFVVSHLLADKKPVIEQSFLAPGIVYASDDGGVAFGGPCARARPSAFIVCVRAPSGGWRELDLEGAAPDGGKSAGSTMAPFGDAAIVRWVPRADGGVVGVVDGATPGVIDAGTGEAHLWPPDALPTEVKAVFAVGRRRAFVRGGPDVVDRSWTATAGGGLRAWLPSGHSFSITPDGTVSISPFAFDRMVHAGAFGLAWSKGDRLWQSVDHGKSWIEVLAPLAGHAPSSLQLHTCSAVGCDLGSWYRIGWPPTPPVAEAALTTVTNPARVGRPPMPTLSCKTASEVHAISLPPSERSPEDFGIGAMKLPSPSGDDSVRILFDRHGVNPAHAANGSHGSSDYAAPRLLLYGPPADPEHNVLAVRRPIAFVAPFDPGATVRKTSFGVSELVAQARAIGLRASDVLGADPTAVAGVAPVASLDPAGAGDIVFFGATGAVGVLRSNPSGKSVQRIAVHAWRGEGMEPVSAVATAEGEVAILGLDSSGTGHVIKLGPLGVSELFEAPSPPAPALYPANVDAVAMGPRGDVALIRTASGGDPPTAADPAILLVPGASPAALAPWSTLTSADDDACKADTTGYRALIQTVAPWVRLAGTEPEPDDDAPMLARVRWSDKRVCLEAIELRTADTAIGGDVMIETWMVAHLTAPATAGKVAVVPGTEMRQAMTCALTPAR